MFDQSRCAPSSSHLPAGQSQPDQPQPDRKHLDTAQPDDAASSQRLSYKFQRLRERLRAAIASGELSGKLPGERQLAKRFRVNAKTLSKALTDLAAEGLLQRSIGRGTYVCGAAPQGGNPTSAEAAANVAAPAGRQRWLAVCDADQTGNPVLAAMRQLNPQMQMITDLADRRPSFLMACDGAVIFGSTDEASVRDLLVRGKTVVFVDREPAVFSTHAVLIDRALGTSLLMRDLLFGGHRKIAVVQEPEHASGTQGEVVKAARLAQARYTPDAAVEPCELRALASAIVRGVTAVLCASAATADAARPMIEQAGGRVGQSVALAAVGYCGGESPSASPCTGYFVEAARAAETVAQLLSGQAGHRPQTMWLTGPCIDCGTLCAAPEPAMRQRASA